MFQEYGCAVPKPSDSSLRSNGKQRKCVSQHNNDIIIIDCIYIRKLNRKSANARLRCDCYDWIAV